MKKREGLPFKHIEEPKKFGEGAESEVFEFKPEKGKEYVFKEMRFERVVELYHGKTLEEKASDMKVFFDILKKHYGDKIAKTWFIIGKNKNNESCVIKIQKKIKGDLLYDLKYKDKLKKYKLKDDDPRLKDDDPRLKDALKQTQEIKSDAYEVAHKIIKDPRLRDYSIDEARSLIADIDNSENIIVDKKGNITVIDW